MPNFFSKACVVPVSCLRSTIAVTDTNMIKIFVEGTYADHEKL